MDRNVTLSALAPEQNTSLSVRRAWIEILAVWAIEHAYQVALRKESVDRNMPLSSSPRLASVALRKESVDRNGLSYFYIIKITRRSP